MLFVFHGTNTHKVADQTSKLVKQLLQKKPDAQVFYFEGGSINESDLDSLIEAQGLFVEKHIVVLKLTLEVAESRDVVLPRVEQFASTKNVFVISENKLLAEHKKVLTKHAEKIEEHKKEKVEKSEFNVFALGDAYGKKDKRGLWVGYTQALRSGIDIASLHGTLHWAVKNILLAERAGSPEEADQKPYMYSKNKKYSANFTKGELRKHSRELIQIYHDVRRGKCDHGVALERWVLGV